MSKYHICMRHKYYSESHKCPTCIDEDIADQSPKIDDFHRHEVADRCHTINTMTDELLIGHPAMDEATTKLCEEAQDKLSQVMSTVSSK